MAEFIARRIIKERDKSITEGQNKYKAYFVNTMIYANFKINVDLILTRDGFSDCIVDE